MHGKTHAHPKPRIVIVGAGFAGIAAAQKLNTIGSDADITLVSKHDTFEYVPALYKLVTGALAIEVSVPLNRIKKLSAVSSINGVFKTVDPARQVIVLEDNREIPYDYLVLALGSETNYFNITGLPEMSLGFKSVKEAFRLRRHFCDLFGVAMTLPKPQAVSKLHTVIVGGGPSGVELAGDLTHYLQSVARTFNVDPSYVTVDLVEASSRILPMMPEKASARAQRRLRTLGVNIYTNRAVTAQHVNEVSISDMNFQTDTVIWTAGTKINSAYQRIPGISYTQRGKVAVSEYLSLPNDNRIFVIGDGAGTPQSGLAQTAIHDGKFIATHITCSIRGEKVVPYVAPKISYIVPVGNYWAMFVHGKRAFAGFLPWILRSLVDFRYVASIVPLWYVIAVFRQGAKYRRSKTYCPID